MGRDQRDGPLGRSGEVAGSVKEAEAGHMAQARCDLQGLQAIEGRASAGGSSDELRHQGQEVGTGPSMASRKGGFELKSLKNLPIR